MSETQCTEQLELFEVGWVQVTMTFDGGQVVSDAGLLPIRELDLKLGILAEAARRMPDPRSEKAVTHSVEDILTQQVYQILAGYPDGNDAQLLRNDPLFKTIVGKDPRRDDEPLASGSTINRFLHAFTRREANADTPELKTMEVGTARVRLFKAGAVVHSTHRRIWFKVASHWPGSKLLTRAVKAVESDVRDLLDMWRSQDLFAPPDVYDPRDRSHIVFAPLPLK